MRKARRLAQSPCCCAGLIAPGCDRCASAGSAQQSAQTASATPSCSPRPRALQRPSHLAHICRILCTLISLVCIARHSVLLSERCKSYIADHAEEVFQTDGFRALSQRGDSSHILTKLWRHDRDHEGRGRRASPVQPAPGADPSPLAEAGAGAGQGRERGSTRLPRAHGDGHRHVAGGGGARGTDDVPAATADTRRAPAPAQSAQPQAAAAATGPGSLPQPIAAINTSAAPATQQCDAQPNWLRPAEAAVLERSGLLVHRASPSTASAVGGPAARASQQPSKRARLGGAPQ